MREEGSRRAHEDASQVTRVRVDHYLGWSREEGPGAGEGKNCWLLSKVPELAPYCPWPWGQLGSSKYTLHLGV